MNETRKPEAGVVRDRGDVRVTSAVRITGGFWKRKTDMVAGTLLPYQWDALNDRIEGAEPSHAVENFRIAAGESEGRFMGTIFQDSDVAKWLEAACYSLADHPDPLLESHVDEAIGLIGKAQGRDGYINTYFTIAAPDKRWTDLAWGHELYCAGHLIEAAVAHFLSTGRRDFLDTVRRYADYIAATFGAEEGKIHGCCGHPEIELALFRLHRLTGERRYRDLALYFLDERGAHPADFTDRVPIGFQIPATRWFRPDYFQAHRPLKGQKNAKGHSVRAMYLYAAMAEAWTETRDPELLASLEALWDSAVSRRMYITGGLGSQAHGERFTLDYDLPSDTAYAETCAAIGMIFWASRMSAIAADSRYADVLERVLYNSALCGVSLDGTRYFYVNPLEVVPEVAQARQDHEHIKTSRVQWFGCACCPPNIARLVASFGNYVYGRYGDTIAVHHYAEAEATFFVDSCSVRIAQRTDYPWSGRVWISVEPERECGFPLKLRIPDWCGKQSCAVNGEAPEIVRRAAGYLEIARRWRPGDVVELDMEMPVRIMFPDPRIQELAGKAAIQRGPLVYCVESVDNGVGLHRLILDPEVPAKAEFEPGLMGGSVRITLSGFRDESELLLPRAEGGGRVPYGSGWGAAHGFVPANIVAVPYHQWGNREPGGEMRVWLNCVRALPRR